MICTLGNFATKLLSGDQTGITRVHGTPRAIEIAGHPLYLYPIFHPAAALYTPAMLTTLKEDFSRLPELIAHAAPTPGEEAAAPPAAERPAWRPPERLRRDAPAPAPAAEPEAGSATAVEPARRPAERLRPRRAPSEPNRADPAPAAGSQPEPEQLGLF